MEAYRLVPLRTTLRTEKDFLLLCAHVRVTTSKLISGLDFSNLVLAASTLDLAPDDFQILNFVFMLMPGVSFCRIAESASHEFCIEFRRVDIVVVIYLYNPAVPDFRMLCF
jgi:hypothetical protein